MWSLDQIGSWVLGHGLTAWYLGEPNMNMTKKEVTQVLEAPDE